MGMTYQRRAIVMAGGSGERFWPLSRRLRPKQLLKLASPDRTLIQQTVARIAPLVGDDGVIIATAPHLVDPVREDLPGLAASQVVAEPHKRNTAGCLVWVAAQMLAEDSEARQHASMAVIAADHRITPDDAFREVVDAAMTLAETRGGIVTIGIRPSRPETGYGYIEVVPGSAFLGGNGVTLHQVQRFREKPNLNEAKRFLEQGGFLWNSGMFFWTLDTFLTELEKAAPELYVAVPELAELLRLGDTQAAEDRFARLGSISIDYALMEKAEDVYVAEANFDWDDVGSWDALDRSLHADEDGNVVQGEAVAVDVQDCIIVNESQRSVSCLLGVRHLVVVVTDDAVLVCDKAESQRVRAIVEALRERGIDRT